MAKSAILLLLLVVLAVAVCLDGARMVSAAGAIPEVIVESYDAVINWIKLEKTQEWLAEEKEKASAINDRVEKAINKFKDTDPQGLRHLTVTDIKVGEDTLGDGRVILIMTLPFPLLDTDAYGLVKNKFPASKLSTVTGDLKKLCEAGDTTDELKPVTLVLDVEGKEVELTRNWYKQRDGSMCLGILSSP